MKTFLLAICVIMLGLNISNARDIPCNDVAKLTIQLKSIRDSDQNIKALLIKQMSQPGNDAAHVKLIAGQMHAIDKTNQLFIVKCLIMRLA